MMQLPNTKARMQEEVLLKQCSSVPQAALGMYAMVSRANNATTYSEEFCDSAADLIRLYLFHKIEDPVRRLSQQFMTWKVLSCRGLPMDYAKTQYLYKTKLVHRLRDPKFAVLDNLTKAQCIHCKKWRYDIDAHIRDAHHNSANGAA